MMTLLEAREGSLKNVAGACTNTPEFRSRLNEATEQLMYRGDWKGTVVPIRVCVSAGCVVFPHYVGEIRAVKVCSYSTPLRSMWYDFLPRCDWAGCGWGNVSLTQNGEIPVFQDVMGSGRLIRGYPRVQADIGKTFRVFGTDDYGQTLTTNNGDGTWSDGVVVTLAMPYGSTNVFVRHIDRVIKDQTQGPVNVFAYNAADNKLESIAQYEPTDTNPSYVRYRLSGCGDCVKSIVALVKLRFIPAETDTDLVLIDNTTALKSGIQSATYREAGDFASARACIIDAVEVLNRQLEDSQPDDSVPVSIGGLQQSCAGTQRIW